MLRVTTATVLLLLGLIVEATAQELTLRQLVIQHQGQVGRTEMACGWAGAPLKSIVTGSDFVLEGIVLSKRTYATPDERDILTEYQFASKQVILQRIIVTSDRPGIVPPSIFKTRGGTVTFDGYPFTLDVQSSGRRVQLREGDHVIMFGKHDPNDGKWSFTPWDVFNVTGDTVLNDLPTLEGLDEGLTPGMPFAIFVAKVRVLALLPR